MGDLAATKKRKRNGVDAVADAAAATKKSKKVKAPPPKEVEESEEESEDEDENEEEVEEDDEDGSEGADNSQDEDGSEASDDEQGSDLRADRVLPADATPLVPLASDSQTFDELKLSDKTMKAIGEMGFTKMTTIQRSVCFAISIAVNPDCIL